MGKGINIPIANDTREFAKGVKSGMIEPLEDAADSLDDLAKDGANAGDKIERAMKDAQGETSEFKKRQQELGRELADNRDKASQFGKSVKQGTDEASEGVQDFKAEAQSNAQEVAASFDGSAQGIVDGAQGFIAAALAGFGPLGIAAGLALAAAVGIGTAMFEKGKEDTQAFKDEVGELTTELIDAGRKGAPALQRVVDKLKAMAAESGEGLDNLKELSDIAKDSKNNYQDLAQAFAGNSDELNKLVAAGKDRLDQLKEEADLPDLTPARTAALWDQITAQEEYNTKLTDAKTKVDLATEAEQLYVDAGGPELAAKADQISLINDAYDEAAGAASDFVDEESKLFNVDSYIASMDARQKALDDYQETLRTSALTPEAKAFLNSQGAEAASTFAAGYKTASPEQQAALNKIWSEAGAADSGTYADTLIKGVKDGLPKTIALPRIDTTDAEADIARFLAKPRKVDIPASIIDARTGTRVN